MVTDFLRDTDGDLSSKRVAAFIAFASFLGFAVVDVVLKKAVSDLVLNNLMYVVLGGLGLATAERFTKPKAERFTKPTAERFTKPKE